MILFKTGERTSKNAFEVAMPPAQSHQGKDCKLYNLSCFNYKIYRSKKGECLTLSVFKKLMRTMVKLRGMSKCKFD